MGFNSGFKGLTRLNPAIVHSDFKNTEFEGTYNGIFADYIASCRSALQ